MSTTADDETTSILIVDDLPEKILVYRSVLEELGQNIVTAASGHEALKQVLKSDFAVILLDVNMPDIDGFETARLIRNRRASAHVPIIFLTAFADEVRIAEGYATGGVDYLPTPVVPEVLQAKVRVFVDLYRMRQQVARQAEQEARRAAAEEQARRAAFLAEASTTLTSSLDFEATRRGLLRLVVPGLAELAAVTQADDDRDWQSELAWGDRGEVRFQTFTNDQAPRDALRDAHDRVLRRGLAESVAGIDVPYPFGPGGPDQHIRTALIIPLQARGRTLGALTLARSDPARPWDAGERALAEDLAGRAAIALDNALLVRDIQENDLRKDEFLAMLAHELRNPLAPIRTGLDLLALDGGDAEVVEPMRRQVEHLVRLVDDLLDVSRITRGAIDLQLQTVDLKRTVATAVDTSRPLIDARRHELSVSLPPQPLRVKGDPVRLTQILTNLLNNAAKYTPDGGHVSLAAETDGGDVVLRVRDDGMGIARDMLSKVFDLFVQADRSLDRSQGGLGIGLTLVRRLVEMHGGVVEVRSEGLGLGSEFAVRLPALGTDRAEPNNGARAPAASREATPCRVLVVDDNTDAAATLGMLLRVGGHEVRLAHDGPSALEAAAEFAPAVVLLDIGLPGLDGHEVARRLRANPAHEGIVLIAVSGYGQDEDRRRAYEAGFDHHLTKPVDFAALRAALPSAAPLPAAT